MKPGLNQSTQLRQELKINPRLYQAMDLLYMPLLDLQQHLKQELLNNPFLEMVEPEEEEDENEAEAEVATLAGEVLVEFVDKRLGFFDGLLPGNIWFVGCWKLTTIKFKSNQPLSRDRKVQRTNGRLCTRVVKSFHGLFDARRDE